MKTVVPPDLRTLPSGPRLDELDELTRIPLKLGLSLLIRSCFDGITTDGRLGKVGNGGKEGNGGKLSFGK